MPSLSGSNLPSGINQVSSLNAQFPGQVWLFPRIKTVFKLLLY